MSEAATDPGPPLPGGGAVPGGPGALPGRAASLAADPDGLRDIHGPVPIPSTWTLPAAIAAVLVVGLLFGLWISRRRGRGPAAEPPPPADRVALERLERARALLEPERAREFVAAISGAVREYVEAISGTHAPRLTTQEFLREISRREGSPLAGTRDLLADFLRRCDLVKFARAELARDEMTGLLESGRRFVLETRPAAGAQREAG